MARFTVNPQLAAMAQRAHQVLQGRNMVAHADQVVAGQPPQPPSAYLQRRRQAITAAQQAQIAALHDWQHPQIPGMRGIGGLPQPSPVTSVLRAARGLRP